MHGSHLDSSYNISRRYRLAIIVDARYWHYPSPSERVSQYWLYIVRKHQLSIPKSYSGIMIRFFMTIGLAIKTRNMDDLRRALGNCMGVI